ncbi:MAG: hypothetical protein M2R45_04102 [Verrucomicrobia subdivision 3 bacterium]|nr:hypothetical protein [Limisphaerales bacterium]MCS1417097.1 hypothetical protein [Limisphaerales bacterium]
MLCAEMMKLGTELTSPGHSRRVPPPPSLSLEDRPPWADRGQGLKLTLAALLTALALQSDASAVVALNTLRGQSVSHNLDGGLALRFEVGPIPDYGRERGDSVWQLDIITMHFGKARGNPSGFEAKIYRNDDNTDLPGETIATLTLPDLLIEGNYSFNPRTVLLQPGVSYWLAYEDRDATEDDFYVVSLSNTESVEAAEGWSIGDRPYVWDEHEWSRPDDPSNPLSFSFALQTAVPEPSEYALFFALGLGAFALWHRRRQAGQRAVA